jgi:hypothetical protein
MDELYNNLTAELVILEPYFKILEIILKEWMSYKIQHHCTKAKQKTRHPWTM